MAIQIAGPAAKALAGAGIANAGANALSALKGSRTDSGSIKSSKSSAKSVSTSRTEGTLASERSRLYALEANANARANFDTAAEYNARQAEISRKWSEYMSNTQYQRSVEDMRKAGINPILAAQNGISGAGISSGATASMTAPETFMGNSIADQNSASRSFSNSESSGSSWSHSESGLATGLGLLADSLKNLQGSMSSAVTVENYISDLEKEGKKVGETVKETAKTAKDKIVDAAKSVQKKVNPNKVYNTSKEHSGGGHKFNTDTWISKHNQKAKENRERLKRGVKKIFGG